MAKNSITDYSKTASLNTDIQSVDIDEGCLPSGINNAIRELMADLAAVNDGTVSLTSPSFAAVNIDAGTIDGTVIGGTTAAAGTFTTLTATGDLTVDTNTLHVDSTNNRVGIGTSSPLNKLDLAEAGDTQLRITSTDGNNVRLGLNSSGTVYNWIEANGTNLLFAVGNAEAMRIDNVGNVGIGTVPKSDYNANYTSSIELPYGVLSGNSTGIETNLSSNAYRSSDGSWKRLKGFNAARLSLNLASSNDSFVFSYAANDVAGSTISWQEAMRIDSSGNVLVGKTISSSATVGITLQPAGAVVATRDGGECFIANRKTSDGTIIQLRKDQTNVGAIGYSSGNFRLDGSGLGLHLNGGANTIYPSNGSGSINNGVVDLGLSVSRFKDLYLSGGVYLGGTGSANKLEDYEEGTFTPAVTGVSGWSLRADGYYTKIGDIVHVFLDFASNTALTGTATNQITGLPFSNARNEISSNVSISRLFGVSFSDSADYVAGVGGTSITFRYVGGDNTANNFSFSGSTIRFTLSATYQTA